MPMLHVRSVHAFVALCCLNMIGHCSSDYLRDALWRTYGGVTKDCGANVGV